MKLNHINPRAPEVKMPEYPGTYYEAMVPATIDLAERAALSVNALTETLDPEYDYELYWIVDLLAQEPTMYHMIDDHVQTKFFQALPLVRTACGSRQNMDVERGQMKTYLHMQGEDGLLYIPIKGRPWALPSGPFLGAGLDYIPKGDHWVSLVTVGRALGAFCVYALKDPEGPWKEAADRLVEGIKKVTIVEDDSAYLFLNCTEPGKVVEKPEAKPVGLRAGANGWVAQGLIQCYRTLGNRDALEIGEKMMRYIMGDSGYFLENGEFTKEFPDTSDMVHTHAHTNQIMAALETVQANGDQELLKRALKAYEYCVKEGNALLGFFPECIGYKRGLVGTAAETCVVADMIACAIKLSLLGIDKWDDVDRWTRNQFAENQLTSTNWLTDGHLEPIDREKEPPGAGTGYGTTERVLERTKGSFSGWAAVNDFVQGRSWSIMHCCTGNGTRTVYYVWENILHYQDGELKVNLLMNRASRWADIDSHIPYKGQVDITVKEDINLKVRLAEWVEAEEAKCTVNGKRIKARMEGRYLVAGPVHPGDTVVVEFPIYERTETIIVEQKQYTIILRGNDAVAINPQGSNGPFYRRGHYRMGETLWRKATRFVPDEEIKWC